MFSMYWNGIEPEIKRTIESLYADNEKKLHLMCNKELSKFGGISQMDYDDFYSRVGWEIALVVKSFKEGKPKYDPSYGKSFMEYLSGVIKQAIWKELTRKNRKKRCSFEEVDEVDENGEIKKVKKYIPNLSLDAPIDENERFTIEDTLQSDFDMLSAISLDVGYSEDVKKYCDSLSDIQRKVAILIMDGLTKEEIKDRLNLTDKEYSNIFNEMKSYDKKRVLYKDNMEDEKMDTIITTEDMAEKYKNTSYSISSISKQLRKKKIRDDHILQRHSGQWPRFAKSELVSDILRGKSLTQIIISEEVKNGIRMQWLIDGKQRCTLLDDYLHNGFSISKNIKNYKIKYQTVKLDEGGNEMLNEEGFPISEVKEFDIRGKKFSQLPEELQDVFKDRQIPVLYNSNCTKKDIAEDIARFNRSRPMNAAQSGWLGLDELFAEFVGNIVKMPFFQVDFKGSSYTKNNHTSGNMRRIIVESIMASDFIDEFNSFDKMCEFLSEEASDSNFTEFYSLVERLTLVAKEEVADMFNLKDSFLWFALFSRFVNTGEVDSRFIDFMAEFKNKLMNKKVNNISFEELCINPETGKSRGTKDKSIVIQKLDLLEALMKEYLHIKEPEEITDEESFISDVVGIDKNEAHENMDVYREDLNGSDGLNGLKDSCIKDGSKLLEPQNNLSLLAMVAYSYKIGQNLDAWLTKFASENNTYIANQRQNYLHMCNDFDEFIKSNVA